jgi:hypothetical protein
MKSKKEVTPASAQQPSVEKAVSPNVWFVTGSNRGIGLGIAQAALQAGDQVRRRRSREEVERLTIEFEASGLRLMEFCRKHGLPPSTLQRHLKRRRSFGNLQEKQNDRLVAAALPGMNGNKDARGACALLVVLSCGWRIEVWPNFDSGTLGRLLSTLERTKAHQ